MNYVKRRFLDRKIKKEKKTELEKIDRFNGCVKKKSFFFFFIENSRKKGNSINNLMLVKDRVFAEKKQNLGFY